MDKSKKKRVLIVEDNEEMRILLEKILSLENLDIIQAQDGAEAIEKIKENKDLAMVISDIKMPVCNGIDMLAKAKELNPKLPVILITAFGDVDQYLDAMNLGAFEYLNKPFKSQELIDVVHRVLKKTK